ncbi:DUF6777 domain-containing protein [Streptomyces sp. NPDC005931]|uniref:DUF6777 domain-containing protein n=1 Tax=Streptomyces sp. NPDC005931 TaxID=3364737 RepID=UPI00367CE2AE
MSVQPPSSGRPTGPPAGPLSGPTRPPTGPPSQPPGGPPSRPGGGDGGPQEPGRRPWWRSLSGLAMVAVAVAATVILAVVFTRGGGGAQAGGGEVFLQAANATGPDPFTESTAKDSSAPAVTPSPATGAASESPTANALRGVNGAAPGLYGGTRDRASCDVEKQIDFLGKDPAKNQAFASVADVEASEVPSHLRSLTPLQLRMDTRVTNHGYRDGAAVPYQAVLQAGTAVLVDDRGVPRVRCACGNPLTDPVEQPELRLTGKPWPGFSPANVVVVDPAPRPVEEFVVHDPDKGGWFERDRGDTGEKDRTTRPPEKKTPSAGVTTTSPSESLSPCAPTPTDASTSPCPSTSTAPSSPHSDPETGQSPRNESPSSEPPSSEPPASDPPPDSGTDTGTDTTTESADTLGPPESS